MPFIHDLDLFIYKISIDYNKPIEYFNDSKFTVINHLQNELLNYVQYIKI